MTDNDNRFKVIKDPVHGSMQFTHQEIAWIMPFIDSENFQRLRHIKQAGLCDWFFPGAVHTRFNHSIGCCYVASQIANKIGLSSKEKQTVMLACLLHDIGHGPFSHLFEQIFYKKCIRHELWTPYFLAEYTNASFLERVNKQNGGLAIRAFDLNVAKKIILHQKTANPLLVDIVSSQLDADRLDYLLRDSHFCGVNYGYYDLRWLLHCLTIVNYQRQRRLGIVAGGVGVVEHYLMARRLMTHNVYQHRKKYASEYLMVQFLKHLAEGLLNDHRFATLKQKTLAKFIMKVNAFNAAIKKVQQFQPLIASFLQDNYPCYRQLCDYDVFSLIRHCANFDFAHPAIDIAKNLQKRNLPLAVQITTKHHRQAKQLIAAIKAKKIIKPWQIMALKLPHQSYHTDHDPILVKNDNNKVRRLDEHSLVMRAVSNQWENTSLVLVDQDIRALPAVAKLILQLKTL